MRSILYIFSSSLTSFYITSILPITFFNLNAGCSILLSITSIFNTLLKLIIINTILFKTFTIIFIIRTNWRPLTLFQYTLIPIPITIISFFILRTSSFIISIFTFSIHFTSTSKFCNTLWINLLTLLICLSYCTSILTFFYSTCVIFPKTL